MKNFLYKIYNSIESYKLRRLLNKGLTVGRNFHMQKQVHIDPCCHYITIGDDVTLAPRVIILAHDASTKKYLGYTKVGKVTIGNKVFVGASSIILPGVNIGNNVIIGAGSVVPYSIPDGVVVAGNPARTITTTEEFLAKRKKEIASFPCFGKEYRSVHITEDRKNEIMEKMKDRYGYIE